MGPRADFECKKCEATYDDLPVVSVRCPVCGFKKGFRRLFNRVNVSGAVMHGAAQIVDKVVAPEYNLQNQIRSEAIQKQNPTQVYNPAMAAAVLGAARAGGNAAYSMPVLNGLKGQGPAWRAP